MRIVILVFVLMGFIPATTIAQESCLTANNLKVLDASWERAQLELDTKLIDLILAEDFVWVHNHANTIDNKAAVLDRANRNITNKKQNTKSRISKDVTVIISGTTGIVSGFTIVDRDPTPTKYHFMRTYVEAEGKCLLLANQTMAVPEPG